MVTLFILFDYVIIMDSIKVIKKLGSGVIGTTYLIEMNGEKYVDKIEKINKDDIYFDLSKNLWREIEFANKFASKYPNHFMQLKSFEIVKECDHVQPNPPPFIQGKKRQDLINKNKSDYCSKLIYSPVLDGTLQSFYNKINKKTNNKAFWSMFCQITYSIGLLIDNGYIHRDTHPGNIMFKKTNKKYIKLGNIMVNTHGMQWFIIDYGLIMHKSYKLNNKDKVDEIVQLNNKHGDLITVIFGSLKMPIWDQVDKHKLKIATFKTLVKNIKATPEYNNIKQYLPNINEKLTLANCIAILFLVLYPKSYHECMGVDVDKYEKYIIHYTDDEKLAYVYIIKNINKPNKIIKFIVKYHL